MTGNFMGGFEGTLSISPMWRTEEAGAFHTQLCISLAASGAPPPKQAASWDSQCTEPRLPGWAVTRREIKDAVVLGPQATVYYRRAEKMFGQKRPPTQKLWGVLCQNPSPSPKVIAGLLPAVCDVAPRGPSGDWMRWPSSGFHWLVALLQLTWHLSLLNPDPSLPISSQDPCAKRGYLKYEYWFLDVCSSPSWLYRWWERTLTRSGVDQEKTR